MHVTDSYAHVYFGDRVLLEDIKRLMALFTSLYNIESGTLNQREGVEYRESGEAADTYSQALIASLFIAYSTVGHCNGTTVTVRL